MTRPDSHWHIIVDGEPRGVYPLFSRAACDLVDACEIAQDKGVLLNAHVSPPCECATGRAVLAEREAEVTK